jgi:flagellar export protein FliJ
MAKFEFRLQKVLEYRELEEQWAKEAYLEHQVQRIAAESEAQEIARQRSTVLRGVASTLEARLSLQALIERYDDEERAKRAAISLLEQEEERARQTWIERKQDKEALIKLKEIALAEWQHEQDRLEQIALDEWTTSRRAA